MLSSRGRYSWTRHLWGVLTQRWGVDELIALPDELECVALKAGLNFETEKGVADSRDSRNGLVSRQRFVARNQEVVDGPSSHDPVNRNRWRVTSGAMG